MPKIRNFQIRLRNQSYPIIQPIQQIQPNYRLMKPVLELASYMKNKPVYPPIYIYILKFTKVSVTISYLMVL